MREKKGGALQKLKKRLSHSFGRLCEYLPYANETARNNQKFFKPSTFHLQNECLTFCEITES